jgi:toxin ParE1/3/4
VKPVRWTNAAEEDLFEISVYTWTEWGEAQYVEYTDRLVATCETLIPQYVKLAGRVPGRPDLSRWRCERHVIYFRVSAEDIEIVRILRERMLPDNHL